MVIIIAGDKRDRGANIPEPEPLSYGRGDEPAHDLLLRRGRATVFLSAQDARDALRQTCKRAEDAGATWPANCWFQIIEAELDTRAAR